MATIQPEFNERLYEFCVNFELVSSIGAFIAGYIPGIPSPQDEADLGWDAEVVLPSFGQTFLLQYKVANLTTARAGPNARFWNVYKDQYFRFRLHRDVAGNYTQHQLLLKASGDAVQSFYCAPLVRGRGQLVDALRKGKVVEQSALIDVATLGPAASGGPHSVSYPVRERAGKPHLHSEPKRGSRVHLDELRRGTPERHRELDAALFDGVSTAILEGRPRRRRREREIQAEDPRAHAYLRASAIAQDELEATLVILPQ